jgi:hypothetical protein
VGFIVGLFEISRRVVLISEQRPFQVAELRGER